MPQRHHDGCRGRAGEERKGRPGRDQTVEAIAGIEAGEDRRRPGRRERLRHRARAVRRCAFGGFRSRDPVGADRKANAEQKAKRHADRRRQQPIIDRKLDQKGAAQGQGQAAQPNEPVLGQRLFPALAGRRGGEQHVGRACRHRRFGRRGSGGGRLGRLQQRLDRRRRSGRLFGRGRRRRFPELPLDLEQSAIERPDLFTQRREPGAQRMAVEHQFEAEPEAAESGDRDPRKKVFPIHARAFQTIPAIMNEYSVTSKR